MSVCQIYIHFDKENRTYQAGDTVTGEVLVRPNEDISCCKIMLHQEMRISAKGKESKGNRRVISTLFNSETRLKKGSNYTYPFKFSAPRTPTYHGRHLSIDWYVRATADIPLNKDRILAVQLLSPSGEATILLKSDRSLGIRRPLNDSHDLNLRSVLNLHPAQLGLIFGIVAVIGGFVVGLSALTQTQPESRILPLLLAIIVAVAGLYMLARYLPIWLAEIQLGQVNLGFSALPRNEGMTSLVRLTPRRTGQIQQIEMKLQIREIAIVSSKLELAMFCLDLGR